MTLFIICFCIYVAGWFTAFATTFIRGFTDFDGITYKFSTQNVRQIALFCLLSWLAVLIVLMVCWYEYLDEQESKTVIKQCTQHGLPIS